jgi:sulfonate transport system substrate-binding protein
MFSRRLSLAGLLGATLLADGFGVAHAEAPKEFRIGYQKSSSLLVVARQQKVFETRLKELGIEEVKWVEFQFGPPLLEALGAGAVDFGVTGDTPPILAQSAGAQVVYAASSPAVQNSILVPKDSPIASVADLKGKKVAFGKGSSSHNFTVQALKKAGLSYSDITPAFLAPADAVAAFTTGSVDAWASEHKEEFAGISAGATGIDLAAQKTAIERYRIEVRPLSDAVVAQQQAIADTFSALKLIPNPVNIRDIVWNAPTN